MQVLLVASSFMSPVESKNGKELNRVRMFGKSCTKSISCKGKQLTQLLRVIILILVFAYREDCQSCPKLIVEWLGFEIFVDLFISYRVAERSLKVTMNRNRIFSVVVFHKVTTLCLVISYQSFFSNSSKIDVRFHVNQQASIQYQIFHVLALSQ